VAVLDAHSSRVTIVNAGHLPVYIREPSGRVRDAGTNRGCLPIGLDATRGYEACEIDLATGSTLAFFTDGISEAMDHEGRLYGLERLEQVIAGPPGASGTAGDVGRRILADVERHAAGQVQSDDICLVCLGRTGGAAAHPAQKPAPARRGGRVQPRG
jgi:sigma-B regulation protein RsbU (phosphoserine phosphatase)